MFLLTFQEGGSLRLGVRTDRGVIDVAAASEALGGEPVPATMDEAIAGDGAAVKALEGLVARAANAEGAWLRDEQSLTLGPSVPHPGKILCVGLNYRKHAEESGAAIPTTPVLFSKFANAVAAHGEEVPLSDVAKEYDYEVELGVVMGKEAKNVSEADALGTVFGYTTANDVSARDLQMRTSQWLLGKTMDKFMPIGPYLVTADAVSNPQALQLRTWHNGTLRQDSNTADMIFPVAEIIAYASKHFTLEPGDVIITGTPAGVIMGLPEKNWMVPGDLVEVEVEGLGKLSNRMAAG
ncbi:MAG: fumarylacetoacetate hydrolase family protein [Thermomicrobiales bacterium]|nr:fumarylacetoacetate hydrolase family protein [Thermomicrobiales bacterium]